MARKKYEFNLVKDVDFKWVEKLFQDSYQDKKAKVIGVSEAFNRKQRKWKVLEASKDSAARSVVKMWKDGYDEVRLVVRAQGEEKFMNIKTNELHKDHKYKSQK